MAEDDEEDDEERDGGLGFLYWSCGWVDRSSSIDIVAKYHISSTELI